VESNVHAYWKEQRAHGLRHNLSEIGQVSKERWPVLCAWRWLVTFPEREEAFNDAVAGGGCLRRRLWRHGRTLRSGDTGLLYSDSDSDSEEEYATAQEVGLAAHEAALCLRRRDANKGGRQVTGVLLLGLRKARACYTEQIEAWKQLRCCQLSPPQPPAPFTFAQRPWNYEIKALFFVL
jgi:hypothetical protein